MRKVRSAPQLTTLPATCLSSRSISDLGDRSPKGGLPSLPRRARVIPRVLTPDLWISQTLDALNHIERSLENEVVVQSGTKTVGVAAEYCFAEFGVPHSYDAPDLVSGSEEDLTETQRELAVCLATPFEGNPEEEGARKEADFVIGLEDEKMYISVEFERKRLRVLRHARRHRHTVVNLHGILMEISQFFAWMQALYCLSRRA